MTPRALLADWSGRLCHAGVPDPEVDASLILSSVTGSPALALRLDDNTDLDDKTVRRFTSLARRRMKREPLQYILNEAPFCGHFFYVDPRVLIPRPETELLCEWAETLLSAFPSPEVLDLCCGSGCIGISVKKKLPSAEVFLTDISLDALAVARLNADRLGADVRLVKGDLFAPLGNRRFHMIISNPPYIPEDCCGSLQPEVLSEPLCALRGGKDGLEFYRRICREAPGYLLHGGMLLMELGDGESADVAALMEDAGFSGVEIRNDFQSLPRMIGGVIL